MILNNPDARRGLRSIVQAVVALAMVAMLYWLVEKLTADVEGLRAIAKGVVIIIGIGTVFYGMENTTRAFDFSIGDWLKAKASKETPAEPIRDGDTVTVSKEPGA